MIEYKVKPLFHSTREINESSASLAIGARNESQYSLEFSFKFIRKWSCHFLAKHFLLLTSGEDARGNDEDDILQNS